MCIRSLSLLKFAIPFCLVRNSVRSFVIPFYLTLASPLYLKFAIEFQLKFVTTSEVKNLLLLKFCPSTRVTTCNEFVRTQRDYLTLPGPLTYFPPKDR